MAAAVTSGGTIRSAGGSKPLPSTPGPKIHDSRPLTHSEQNRIATKVQTYLVAQSNLTALERQSKASEDRIIENRREAVRAGLSQKVFGVEKAILLQTITQNDLDKISCDLQVKKCFITDTPGVESVILPFLKAKNITTLNLLLFKDEITPKAMIALFKGLPETKVTTVILAKTLTAEETAAKEVAEQTIAKLGSQLIIAPKAS
jgi:hypothetical protein